VRVSEVRPVSTSYTRLSSCVRVNPNTCRPSRTEDENHMESHQLASARARAAERGTGVIELAALIEGLRPSVAPEHIRTLYTCWIEHHPDDPMLYAALYNHAVVLTDAGDLTQARACLERVLSLNPEFIPAQINLGRIHERLGVTGLALRFWSNVVSKLAGVTGTAIIHKVTALNQAARVLEAGNQDAAAETMLFQSLDADPTQREAVQHYVSLRQRQCKWPVLEPWERMDRRALMRGMSPLSADAYTDDPLLHLALAADYNQRDVGSPAPGTVMSHRAARHAGRLRIGYLSSDLRGHAVGYLMAELFELHDRSRVEIFAYYCGPEPTADDRLNARFRASADHWVQISHLDDAAAAERIVADGIHILVDVNGYTREARSKLVALRPAPVIVNWLGYPGTTGSPYHHYIIADDWIIPKAAEIFYSEKVLRLPCYQPSDRRRVVAPLAPTRSDAGLPDDAMVYCCFNATHKITRFTFERWLSILRQVPRGVLWLLAAPETTCQRLRDHAGARGIAPERLVFAEKLANPLHLARHRLADLFLDTVPYGAHTTCSDALWMGVPVLTVSGRSFASRVCGSLVRAAGLPDLVCSTAERYVELAIALGQEEAGLEAYRDRLETGRESCVLFDMPLLVRRLEQLFATMWRHFESETLPRPDLANLDIYLEVGDAVDHEQIEVGTMDDYRGWWRNRLSQRHAVRPIRPDRRLCGASWLAGLS
jgi:predicted O-linked N-acetylglucosamine transferase (SPINDLY family)